MRCKRRIRRLLLMGIPVISVLAVCFLIGKTRPLIRELAVAKVENHAQYVVNEAIEDLLEDSGVDYANIVLLEKDVSGRVTALRTNIAEINRLKTRILAAADNRLMDLEVEEIGLPLGSLVMPTFFSGSGPKLPVRVLSVSNSDAEYHNVFSEAGINQTTHQIMMDVILDMTILTPAGTEAVRVVSSVVVAETVIVGIVPQSYVNVGE